MNQLDVLVELRLQRALVLSQLRAMAGGLRAEFRAAASRTLGFHGDRAEPLGDAQKWALHRIGTRIHAGLSDAPREKNQPPRALRVREVRGEVPGVEEIRLQRMRRKFGDRATEK